MGADRNKHCGTERMRQRWLGSAKAWGHGGAVDKSGSSFGKVCLETFLPWMPRGASDGDCGVWVLLQAISPLRPAWPRSVRAFSARVSVTHQVLRVPLTWCLVHPMFSLNV